MPLPDKPSLPFAIGDSVVFRRCGRRGTITALFYSRIDSAPYAVVRLALGGGTHVALAELMPAQADTRHAYTFDAKLFAVLTIRADSEQAARARLTELMAAAVLSVTDPRDDCDCTFDASLDGLPELTAIDNEET